MLERGDSCLREIEGGIGRIAVCLKDLSGCNGLKPHLPVVLFRSLDACNVVFR